VKVQTIERQTIYSKIVQSLMIEKKMNEIQYDDALSYNLYIWLWRMTQFLQGLKSGISDPGVGRNLALATFNIL